jgi:hypothetical protein
MWGYATEIEIKIRRRAVSRRDDGNGYMMRWNRIDSSILALFFGRASSMVECIIVPCVCVTVPKNNARTPLPAARGLYIP